MGKVSAAPKLIGVKEAAASIGLSHWTVRLWCHSGKISSHKLGSRLMVSVDEIERVIRETERPRVQGAA